MTTTTPTVPMTLLQAANMLLNAIGAAEVTTLLNTATNEETQKAVTELNVAAIQVQSRDWNFNSDADYPLLPDAVTGEIAFPANALFKGLSERSSWHQATVRGSKVWNLRAHTFIWGIGTNGNAPPNGVNQLSGPLFVDLSWLFVFECLPQPIRWLITAQAGRNFGTGRVPDQDTYRFTDVVYEDALAFALSWDGQDTAMFSEDNPHWRYMRHR